MTAWPSTRAVLAVGLLVAFLLAGFASYYASAHPDGLERVAGQAGFLEAAEDSPTAESPLAGYETRGVDDDRASGAIAGITGVAVMAVLSTGLFWALRRRDAPVPADSLIEEA
jgi:cobalt/nickel transport system permease protein/cobalt/nickel transport protein